MTTTTPRPALRRTALLGWLLALAAALAALVSIGRDRPGFPPLDPQQWTAWAAERETVDVFAACFRVGAAALVGYLLAATIAQLVLRRWARPTARRRAARAAPAFVATLTAAAVASAGPASAASSTDPLDVAPGQGATMERVDDSDRTQLPWADPAPAPTSPTPATDPAPATDSAPVPAAPVPPPPTAVVLDAGEWIVAPGDHLWGIAEQVLLDRTGSPPDDRDVHRYWVRLLDANADRLVDPDNPDLIVPGQRFTLPPD